MMKHPRVKSDAHLRFIRQLPCLTCLAENTTEASHIRGGDRRYAKRPTGLSEKPDDAFTLPLCGICHRKSHSVGENAFWSQRNIDAVSVSLGLWKWSGESDFERAEMVIRFQHER